MLAIILSVWSCIRCRPSLREPTSSSHFHFNHMITFRAYTIASSHYGTALFSYLNICRHEFECYFPVCLHRRFCWWKNEDNFLATSSSSLGQYNVICATVTWLWLIVSVRLQHKMTSGLGDAQGAKHPQWIMVWRWRYYEFSSLIYLWLS